MAQGPDFTPNQQHFADHLISTKTLGKFTRREGDTPETYRLVEGYREMGMIDFAQDQYEFALNLHRQPGKISEELSPFFINLRNLGEKSLDLLGDVLAELPIQGDPYFCTGIPNAATPIARIFSEKTGIPCLDLLIKEGEGPAAQLVPHPYATRGFGSKLLVIDDLITGANAKLAATKILEGPHLKYKVTGFAVAFDRQGKGADELATRGYHLSAALQIRPLFDYYHATGQITPKQYQASIDYLGR